MDVILLEIFTDIKPLQFLKAEAPIDLTLLGIVNDSRLLQL